jgi:hypothetical protein
LGNAGRVELEHPSTAKLSPVFLLFVLEVFNGAICRIVLISIINAKDIEKSPLFEPPKVFELLEERF